MDEIIKNYQINKEKNFVKISVNPKIFSLDVVYLVAYSLLDRLYVEIDGNPREEIIVILKPKNKGVDLEEIAKEFNNELINSASFLIRYKITKPLREKIIESILK